jgi:hypothetical protein
MDILLNETSEELLAAGQRPRLITDKRNTLNIQEDTTKDMQVYSAMRSNIQKRP